MSRHTALIPIPILLHVRAIADRHDEIPTSPPLRRRHVRQPTRPLNRLSVAHETIRSNRLIQDPPLTARDGAHQADEHATRQAAINSSRLKTSTEESAGEMNPSAEAPHRAKYRPALAIDHSSQRSQPERSNHIAKPERAQRNTRRRQHSIRHKTITIKLTKLTTFRATLTVKAP